MPSFDVFGMNESIISAVNEILMRTREFKENATTSNDPDDTIIILKMNNEVIRLAKDQYEKLAALNDETREKMTDDITDMVKDFVDSIEDSVHDDKSED